jgi:hypothetical protein
MTRDSPVHTVANLRAPEPRSGSNSSSDSHRVHFAQIPTVPGVHCTTRG